MREPNVPTEVVCYSQARTAIANAHTVAEVKAIRDHGHSAVQHAKRVGIATRQQIAEAMRVILEAERRAGEMLAGMVRQGQHGREGNTELLSLSDLGISKMQSHRWQTIAGVSEPDFHAWLEEQDSSNIIPSTSALYRFAQSILKPPTESTVLEGCETTDSLPALIDAGKRFACIYADPPWAYSNAATRASVVPMKNGSGKHGRKSVYKAVMSVDDICDEPVEQLAADESHLFLWTTTSFLPDAFRVIDAWGFNYKSNMVWVKPQMGIGNYVRVCHEHLLIAVKGGKRTNGKSQRSWIEADRTKHSRKPDVFRHVVEQLSEGPFLEMYGREPIEGWTVYGNEIEPRLFNG